MKITIVKCSQPDSYEGINGNELVYHVEDYWFEARYLTTTFTAQVIVTTKKPSKPR
jgi:hypothetical protein